MEFCNDCLKNLVANHTGVSGSRYNAEQMSIEPFTEIFDVAANVGDVRTAKPSVFYYGDLTFTYIEDAELILSGSSTIFATQANFQIQNVFFSSLAGIARGQFLGKKITLNSRT